MSRVPTAEGSKGTKGTKQDIEYMKTHERWCVGLTWLNVMRVNE